MTTISQPTGLTLNDWTDTVVRDLAGKGLIGRIIGEDWQSWGAQLRSALTFGLAIPDPYGFDDWQKWAQRVCGAIG